MFVSLQIFIIRSFVACGCIDYHGRNEKLKKVPILGKVLEYQ